MLNDYKWLKKVKAVCDDDHFTYDLADYTWFKDQGLAILYLSKLTAIQAIQRLTIESALYAKRVLKQAEKVFHLFNEHKINYVLLKGYSLATTYDAYYHRPFGDLDILVAEDDIEAAKSLVLSLGYQKDIDYENEKHWVFMLQGELPIELHHKSLESEYDETKLDLWLLENSEVLDIQGCMIRVPIPQAHFYFIVLHMMNHFYTSGCGVRHLLDIKFFIEKHGIDPVTYTEMFTKHGLSKLYRVIISLCVYQLGLNIKTENWLMDHDEPLLYQVYNYMVCNGIFGLETDVDQVRLLRVKYLNQWHQKKFLKALNTTFFPTKYDLPIRCRYAMDKPFLLPVAWIHRVLSFIFANDRSVLEKCFFFIDANGLTTERNQMMKALEINK